jgi:DNA-binding winged helix-turn-helix (wHTH) protein/predicted ATPase
MASEVLPAIQLDLGDERLRRGGRTIPLRPKTFALLRAFVAQPGRLLTKTALLDTVWGDTVVSDVVLMVCIRELRQALGDNASTPLFIETVHRRGYRFVGNLTPGRDSGDRSHMILTPRRADERAAAAPGLIPIGRGAEVDRLHHALQRARAGSRQIVFVTGEAGIGKTTLVDTFLRAADQDGELHIGRGQCIEHYGTGEAYLPVLEALGGLCRRPGGHAFTALLGRHAPSWLAQMPGLVDPADLQAAQYRPRAVTRERMLREMAETIEAATADRLMVFVLEDLHWTDHSTLDLIVSLARRREPARFLLIGVYRPPDALRGRHPVHAVKQELQVHRQCDELPLSFLTEDAIAEYLAGRCPGVPRLRELAGIIHRRTEGNPLFMVNIVDAWCAGGFLTEADGRWFLHAAPVTLEASVPENLRQMIEHQLDLLEPEERRVLEAASIAGAEFSTAAIAAGLENNLIEVEECCARLARRGQLLYVLGEIAWPDGTVAGRYGFLHALYQDVLSTRIPGARRRQLHQRIGSREESGYGTRVEERAAALAVHFERASEPARALVYLRLAAATALRRHAYADAIGHLTTALALLAALPESSERLEQELDLQISLGPALMATRGYAASEVEHTYVRARDLCRQLDTTARLFPVLVGLRRVHVLRANLETARALEDECLALATASGDHALLLEAHLGPAVTLCFQGAFDQARGHAEQGIALYDAVKHGARALVHGDDLGVGCLTYAGLALWFLGYPDQALQKVRAALALAERLSHPFSLAYAVIGAAWLHQFRREPSEVRKYAEAAARLSREHGFPLRQAQGAILHGSASAALGETEQGVKEIREGLNAFTATGARLNQTFYLALLAEAHRTGGDAGEALRVMTRAVGLLADGGECWWEAELHRQRGILLWQIDPTADLDHVEAEFTRALEVARRQHARSLELRAVLSLAELSALRGGGSRGRAPLAEVYGRFTEGFDTPDLVEARTLVDELPRPSA